MQGCSMWGLCPPTRNRTCALVVAGPESSPLDHQGCPAAAAAKSLQSCPTLCDPIDGSPPGSPVPGILEARALERVGAIAFSEGSPTTSHF